MLLRIKKWLINLILDRIEDTLLNNKIYEDALMRVMLKHKADRLYFQFNNTNVDFIFFDNKTKEIKYVYSSNFLKFL